jgi:hypothetical protein
VSKAPKPEANVITPIGGYYENTPFGGGQRIGNLESLNRRPILFPNVNAGQKIVSNHQICK